MPRSARGIACFSEVGDRNGSLEPKLSRLDTRLKGKPFVLGET